MLRCSIRRGPDAEHQHRDSADQGPRTRIYAVIHHSKAEFPAQPLPNFIQNQGPVHIEDAVKRHFRPVNWCMFDNIMEWEIAVELDSSHAVTSLPGLGLFS